MEQFIFGLKLTAIGMSVVFVALITVQLVLNLFKRLDRRSTAVAEPAAESAPTEGLSPEVMAAIAAAVTLTVGKKARIKRIQYRSTRPERGWAMQGRMTIMASHIVKR